jgi:hypothetical protein
VTTVKPPTVGRTWYLELKQGTLGSQLFLGTRHVATGDQVWERKNWGTDLSGLTELEILDELYGAVLSLMEARTHVG